MNKKTHTRTHTNAHMNEGERDKTQRKREKEMKKFKKLKIKKKKTKKMKSETFSMKNAKPHVTILDISGCIACVVRTHTYLGWTNIHNDNLNVVRFDETKLSTGLTD